MSIKIFIDIMQNIKLYDTEKNKMIVNSINNSNSTTFGARFKINCNKTFKEPDKYFEEWLAEKQKKWAQEARWIGSDKDRITINLGKNDIKTQRASSIFRKQNVTAESKINGIKIKNDDLKFEYTKIGDSIDRYYYNLEERIEEYIKFIKRLASSKISK